MTPEAKCTRTPGQVYKVTWHSCLVVTTRHECQVTGTKVTEKNSYFSGFPPEFGLRQFYHGDRVGIETCTAGAKITWSYRHSSNGALQAPSNELRTASKQRPRGTAPRGQVIMAFSNYSVRISGSLFEGLLRKKLPWLLYFFTERTIPTKRSSARVGQYISPPLSLQVHVESETVLEKRDISLKSIYT